MQPNVLLDDFVGDVAARGNEVILDRIPSVGAGAIVFHVTSLPES